jgi:crotonobetainyl-CoA:carnitine CoA-transferase CaiB-like acyl-CoA transferase
MIKRTLPLAGIRIVDLSMVWAGPLAARLLCDLGAEVIKVESCQRMDFVRYQTLCENEPRTRPWERSWYYTLHRSKHSITLDLTKPQGVAVLKALVKISDVVMENYSPRVMKNLGVPYEALREIKPDIIMLSMSAYGQNGPYREYIGYGATIEPVSGTASICGYEGDAPVELDSILSDPTASYAGAGAILMALEYRDRTGKGQYIDLSELESVSQLVGGELVDFTLNGRSPTRHGNRHSSAAPHNVYRCAGDDAWVAIACYSEAQWEALCRVLGRPDLLSNPRFSDILARYRHQDELTPAIEEWTRRRPPQEAMQQLQRAGVPAGALLSAKNLQFDPHLRARAYWVPADHDEIGLRPVPGQAFKFSRTPGMLRWPTPLLGEYNERVLQEHLGLSRSEVEVLRQQNIIGNEPIPNVPPEVVPFEVWKARGAMTTVDSDYLEQLRVRKPGEKY